MPPGRFDVTAIAQSATDRLGTVATRARVLAKGALLFALAGGVLAYAVGWFTLPPSARTVWGVVGLVVCAIPALAVVLAMRRMQRVVTTLPQAAVELQGALSDTRLRESVYALLDRGGDDQRTPLVALGKELGGLRSAAEPHRETLRTAWQSISALTTLPGVIALAIVGTIGLFIFAAVAVLARLILGT